MLPSRILNARTLLLEVLRLLDLHGTMRVRRREDHRGTSYVFTIVILVEDAVSTRDLKREHLRRR